MYTEKQIEAIIRPIISLYSGLEEDLILDIAKRLKISDKATGTLAWKTKKLKELGGLNKKNLAKISYITKKSEKQITEAINDITLKAIADDDILYTKAIGKIPPISKQTLKILEAAQKSATKFQNLVGSRAFESANKAYREVIEKTYGKVLAGQTDYNTAIRSGISKLSDEGLTGFTYKSKKGRITRWNLDTAMRQMTLDSTTRATGQMQLDRAKQVGSNLVEVSSHVGERPSHAEWSGRIYQLEGSDKYPNFYRATHYGEDSAEALQGYNCRHTFYPYFEGISEKTFKPQPKRKNKEVYEQRSEQRFNERQIRQYKCRANALQAIGDKQGVKQANAKVREWQSIQRKHLKDNPILGRDYARERI